jgi:hypothetical protein
VNVFFSFANENGMAKRDSFDNGLEMIEDPTDTPDSPGTIRPALAKVFWIVAKRPDFVRIVIGRDDWAETSFCWMERFVVDKSFGLDPCKSGVLVAPFFARDEVKAAPPLPAS